MPPATENAIRAALTQYVDTRRGDPVPVVRSFQFAQKSAPTKTSSTTTAPTTGATTGNGTATGANGAPDAIDLAAAAGSGSVPTWAIVGGSLVGLILVMTIVLMWRRNAKLAAERRLFEQEFRNDTRMFEDYSSANPGALAQQLNDLFNQPSAPVR